ncbi:collagen alpha-1(XII) chain-like [Mercenaria mercenaria]|uniref:collagen alpha-1(XII) chain-like n=1 Tax=Mercenaria mercenaria TaxID=6596 RepID=UPI00234F39EC|nr:collagen alpha-1(XII) chain-like [Mercenaria mercenaria]XP_053373178.1 collagen alpha-1(XII) chain-like [Mercenaria mercenaria]
MELFFLIDSSGSIGQTNFGIVKEFVKNVSAALDIGPNKTRVGLMTYSRYPFIRFNIIDTLNKSEVLGDVDNVPYVSGLTETHTALRLLQQEGYFGSRSNVPHVAILITEGTSLHSNETKAAAASLHRHRIQMFVLGIGQAISSTELHNIATDPDNMHLITVKRYESLPSILEKLTTLTCDVLARTYTPLTTPKPVLIKYAGSEPIRECLGKAADIVFVLDSTTTLGQAHFKSVKHFALDIVNDFDIADNATRIGVISFSTYPLLRLELGKIDDKLQLLNSINTLIYYTGTRETDRALELLRIEGFLNHRPETPDIAILITDGSSTNSFLTMRAADELKQSGVEVFVVGVGENIDMKELGYISTNPKDHVFSVSNFEEFDLSSFEGVVARTICTDIPILTTISTTSSTSSTSKPTSTQQFSSSSSPWIFSGNDTTACFPEVKDIMFVVDSSSRIGDQNFLKMKHFVKQTVETFNIGLNLTRVGLILFSTNATMVFPLDKYNASQEILDAVENIVYNPVDKTNIGGVLEYVRKHGFTYDRQDVPNIAFLITDGYSSDKNSTKLQARLAKQNNTIQILTTAVGQFVDFDELVDIASNNPYTNQSLIYHVDDFDDLHVMSLEDVFTSVICGFEMSTLQPKVSMSTLFASVTQPCYDKVKTCSEYQENMCTSYRPWAMEHCKQYCGFCQGTTTAAKPCVDEIGNCHEYGLDICTSTAFRKWTKDHCPKFCGLCGADTTSSTLTTTTTTAKATSATYKGMLATATSLSS